MDYRDDQLGIQANTGGAILVEGTWYCPALPGPLITATTGLRGHAITRDLYDQQITARACYQLKRKDRPDADGYQRLSCPATGGHPGLICPLRPASLTPRDGRPKVLQPPQEPPRLCRQTAITIAPDVWSTPGLVETRFSPDALVWVAVVFHGTAAWRNHGLIIFPLLFYRTSVQLRCPAAPAGWRAPPARPPPGTWASPRRAPVLRRGFPGQVQGDAQRHRLRRRRRP